MYKIIWLISFMALALSPLQAATFVDKKTNLEWQIAEHGQPLYGSWEQAVAGCNSQTEAGGGWRLPNVQEAASLIQVYKEGPQIDDRMKEAVRSYNSFGRGLYYTSTVAEYDPIDSFWVYYINFIHGTIVAAKENTGVVADGAPYFCVRGG